MLHSAKIAALQTQLDQVSAELTTAKGTVATQLDQITAHEATISAHEATITDLQGKAAAAETRATEAEKKATDAEASINDQVNTRLAAAGIAPIERDPQAKNPCEPGTQAKAEGSPLKRAAAGMGSWKVFSKN